MKNPFLKLRTAGAAIAGGAARFARAAWESERLRVALRTSRIFILKTAYRGGFPIWRIGGRIFGARFEGTRCFVEIQGRVLLVRMTYGEGLWNLPGGRIEKGERPDAAAMREVVEEVGIILPRVYRIGCFDQEIGRMKERLHLYYGESPTADFVIDPVEIAEAKWFKLGHLPAAVADTVLTAVECRDRFLANNTLRV